jgi:small conductance mechanosensitive channel
MQEASPLDPLVAQARLERLDQVERLLAVYRRIPGLREVRIGVEGGVLELRGRVLSSEDRERALEYARALVTGVDFVDDRALVVETDVRRRLEPAYDRIREKGVAFLRFLPSLLLGLLVLGLGGVLAWWLGNRHGIYERFGRNPFAQNLLRQVVRFAVFLVALLLALDLMAITALVGAVLGAAGVAGIAVGFAFRDIVENYLAGVLLSLRQPFAPQDHVQLAGEEGRVIRLTGRETVLMTLDGNHVRIPNATVFKAVITNLTRNPRRRFHFMATVAPWEALGPVIQVTREAVGSVEGVLESPAVAVRISELQDSAVSLRVSGWVDQTRSDFGKARSRAIRAVKEAYEAAGIDTPPPEYGIRILGNDTGGEPLDSDPAAASGDAPGAPAATPSTKPGGPRDAHGTAERAPPGPAPDTPALPPGHEVSEEDTSPDLTIEEEIARELAASDEENLLTPSRPEAQGGLPRTPPGALGQG